MRSGVKPPPSLKGLPKPCSDAELEIVSEFYFGTPLHLRSLVAYKHSGNYEVEEDYSSYNTFGPNGYDDHSRFWGWAIGRVYCGGTARASYGQFRCGHRQGRRLKRWILSRRTGDSSSVRPAFAKVSQVINGPGENTPNRSDRGVLRNGRVDGALSSFATASKDES